MTQVPMVKLTDQGQIISKMDKKSNTSPYLGCHFTHRLPHIYCHSFLWLIWALPSCLGLRKSLTEASKLRHCEAIALWINPLINHLYWYAGTPESDDRRNIVREKFVSSHNHVSNQHTFQGEHFTACAHPPITEERIWLTPGKLIAWSIIFHH